MPIYARYRSDLAPNTLPEIVVRQLESIDSDDYALPLAVIGSAVGQLAASRPGVIGHSERTLYTMRNILKHGSAGYSFGHETLMAVEYATPDTKLRQPVGFIRFTPPEHSWQVNQLSVKNIAINPILGDAIGPLARLLLRSAIDRHAGSDSQLGVTLPQLNSSYDITSGIGLREISRDRETISYGAASAKDIATKILIKDTALFTKK